MDERRTRHWSWLALFVFLVTVSSGCEMPGSGGGAAGTAATPSSSEEAEKTRKIEEKAAEIERMSAEIQNMTGTEQEKIDAVNRLEEKQRELQDLQEGR